MEKIELSQETILKLQYAIVAGAIYRHYLEKQQTAEDAALDTAVAATIVICKLNGGIEKAVDDLNLDRED